MFYIARNSIAITPQMTKRKALALWEANKVGNGGNARYQLCKHTDRVNPTVVMELN